MEVSEPYRFPMEFSGDLAGKMMADEVVWSGYRGSVRKWREECVFVRKRNKRNDEGVVGWEKRYLCEWCVMEKLGLVGHVWLLKILTPPPFFFVGWGITYYSSFSTMSSMFLNQERGIIIHIILKTKKIRQKIKYLSFWKFSMFLDFCIIKTT